MTSHRDSCSQNLMAVIHYFNKLQQFLGSGGPILPGKSRIGSSTLTSSEIATEKDLWSWKTGGISEGICALGQYNNYSYCQILLILLSVSSISHSGTENEDQRLSDSA